MSVPALCTIHQRPGAGGIARVSLLLSEVLHGMTGGAFRTLTLLSGEEDFPSRTAKAAFGLKVFLTQATGGCGWLLYDHIGPATVQTAVPSALRKPYAVFLHSLEVWNGLTPRGQRALEGAAVRISNSEYTKERVLDLYPRAGRIDVCHLCLHPASARPAEGDADRALLDKIRPLSALIVGRLAASEGHKGHDVLIRLWPEVVRRVPGAQLVVLGGGDDLPRLRRLAGECGVEQDVLFTGRVNEATLHAAYERVAAYAMPSAGEGFGLVFLEAMRAGLPCLASTRDASREIVVNGETGFLVDPANSAEVAVRLIELLANLGLRERMGVAGQRREREDFGFERFDRKVRAALAPLTAKGTRAA